MLQIEKICHAYGTYLKKDSDLLFCRTELVYVFLVYLGRYLLKEKDL